MIAALPSAPRFLAWRSERSPTQTCRVLFSNYPVIRGIVVLRRTTKFCRGLGTLLANGVTLTDALRLVERSACWR